RNGGVDRASAKPPCGHSRAEVNKLRLNSGNHALRRSPAMKYLDEYRDAGLAQQFARELHRLTTRPWNIMEVCGGQTHAIVKFGIDELLPGKISLLHGPGCPVCVTPVEIIDQALEIAGRSGFIFTSFGDMLRVPGSTSNLLEVKARGGDVRIVY